MKILINATSVHTGGSLVILQKFVNDHKSDDLIIFTKSLINIKPHHKIVRISTINLFTHFFSLFIFPIFTFIYKPSVTISFSNSGPIFCHGRSYIYLHSANVLFRVNLKYKILYFLFWISSLNSIVLVQTEYMRMQLLKLKFRNAYLSWPGIDIQSIKSSSERISYDVLFSSSNIADPNKNYTDLVELSHKLPTLKFGVPSLRVNKCIDRPNINYFGPMDHNSFLESIQQTKLIMVSSNEESLCLPIYESLLLDVPVLVKGSPYVYSMIKQFPFLTDCLYIYSNIDSVSENEIKKFLLGFKNLSNDYKKILTVSSWAVH